MSRRTLILSYACLTYTIILKFKTQQSMKNTLLSMVFVLCAMSAMAIPAKKGIWKTITLTDGTEVRAELCGDEYAHFWRAADGTAYVKQSNGERFVEADLKALYNKTTGQRQRDNARRQLRANKRMVGSASINSGSHKGLIILVQYPNLKFKSAHNNSYYKNVANVEGFTNSEGYRGSVHDYFMSQSDGKFDLTFDVAGPYTLTHDYEYYGEDGDTRDIRAYDMIKEACVAANADVNFADYDWDGDGEVEQVFVLFAGNGQAGGGDENTIWPHEYVLYPSISLDGTRIYTYACGSELVYNYSSGIGTFCHEFSHCLGLPDMYDTDYSGAYGMGPWSPMDQGSYNGNSMSPANYTSYERMFSGWAQPEELTGEMEIEGMKALGDGGKSYIIYNKSNKNEYYLLENRQLTGWDAALPTSGLVVLHVDYNYMSWAYNTVNDDPSHQRCTVFHADNSSSDEGVPYPYRTNNKLTDKSLPASTLFNRSDGSLLMGYPITEIQQKDGLVSFKAGYPEVLTDLNGPSVSTDGAVFYESFDKCNGQGGNDGFWGKEVSLANFYSDVSGWYYQYGYGADRCAKFGKTGKDGNTATPVFSADGEYDLYFKAAPFDQSGTELTISVNGTGSLDQTNFVMENEKWTECHAKLTANGDIRIVFKPSGLLFLDEVIVKPINSSGIISAQTEPIHGQKPIYTIDGRYVGNDMSKLGKGIYITNGKKVIK